MIEKDRKIYLKLVIFSAHLFGPELDATLQIRIFGGNKMVPPHILWRLLETG